MIIYTTYGVGGYCADCNETHDHPLNNIIEEIEMPEEVMVDASN